MYDVVRSGGHVQFDDRVAVNGDSLKVIPSDAVPSALRNRDPVGVKLDKVTLG